MNGQIMVAMETDKIVLIPLMIAEKEVLTMERPIVFPPTFGLFYSLPFGMIVAFKRNFVAAQVFENNVLTCHDWKFQ